MTDPAILRNYITTNCSGFKENSVSFIFECPRCNKKDKLYIRKRDGRFVCWKCKEISNYKGNPEYALADLAGVSVDSVRVALYGGGYAPATFQLDVDLEGWGLDESEEIISEIEIVQFPWNFYPLDAKESQRGVEYLTTKRQVDLDVAKSYGVRYCPQLRQVIFPVQSNGRLFGWQGRVVYDTKIIQDDGSVLELPKSQSSKGMKSDKLLMFSDNLNGVDHAFVVEGPIDALKAHLCGGNVCTMGKGVSTHQIELLRNSGKHKIILGLDEDASEDTMRLIRDLHYDLDVYVLPELPAIPRVKVDLGELDPKVVLDLFRSARKANPSQIYFFLKPKF